MGGCFQVRSREGEVPSGERPCLCALQVKLYRPKRGVSLEGTGFCA